MYNSRQKPVEPEAPRKVRMIEVIEVKCIRGNGQDTVLREIIQYWSKDGVLLAENDQFRKRGFDDQVDKL